MRIFLLLLIAGVIVWLTSCGGSESPGGTWILDESATIKHFESLIESRAPRYGNSPEAFGLMMMSSFELEAIREEFRNTRVTLKLKSSSIATSNVVKGSAALPVSIGSWESVDGKDGWIRLEFNGDHIFGVIEGSNMRMCLDMKDPHSSTISILRKPWVGERKLRSAIRWVKD